MILLYTGSGKKDKRDIEQILKQHGLDQQIQINDFSAKDPKDAIGITAEHDEKSLEHLKTTKIKAIVCGMSSVCTVTLSSCTPEQAVLCVQRSFEKPDGKKIEPGELPVRLTAAVSPYTVMSVCTALLLCGRTPESI